ncbi:hypothetical protein B7463_g11895, partial [Scytalidium lignicola]
MSALPQYTVNDVAAHKDRDNLWVIIHGKVYDVTKYVRDHPGGQDVLLEVAGTDATAAYEDAGHSEDANEVLEGYLVGIASDAQKSTRANAVRLIQPKLEAAKPIKTSESVTHTVSVTAGSIAVALSLYLGSRNYQNIYQALTIIPKQLSHGILDVRIQQGSFSGVSFSSGFLVASIFCASIGSTIGVKLSKMVQIKSGFEQYPSHKKIRKVTKPNPHLARGFLEPKEYKSLPLVKKDQLSPNVYRFVFQLPSPRDVIGIPIGQHVAIKAMVNGAAVSRSYTPTSNNIDRGRLELVIKCYPDGLLTGQYLANLKLGDRVEFRGPKGAMRYHKGLCKKIGMIAGGTGITPMYQLIRAICEDETDTTEVSLIYANRSEGDILLRDELERFARNYSKYFKLWYMLDHPPQKWDYGKGFVTAGVMAAKLPSPSKDTKVMLCGPPGMVNASKKALVGMGFEAPGAVPKMTDQIFCF